MRCDGSNANSRDSMLPVVSDRFRAKRLKCEYT
jgi:hypothetical protein